MPRVSVVMTCYNAMPFLPQAVSSIRSQTLTDWELIAVDDGSTDGSGDYLDNVAEIEPRVRVIRQANAGQHVAAMEGIGQASAPLIARMDADDVAIATRLERQTDFLDSHPEVGLVGGQIERLGSNGSGLTSKFPTGHDAIVAMLRRNRHAICNPTILFRKEVFTRIGGYWEHDIAEDWDMFLRMGELSRLANLDEVLLRYRFHRGSINGRRIVEAQIYNEYAVALSLLRERGEPEISIEEFKRTHRSGRFPASLWFTADAHSIGHYREAVADLYGGHRLRGCARLAWSMLLSPPRTLRRIQTMLRG